METPKKTIVKVEATVNAPIKQVWKHWSEPGHIMRWNNASDDWHTPRAENNLKSGGAFCFRMEARDGSFGFDFSGVYDTVKPHELIDYTIDDGRKVKTTFEDRGNFTHIVTRFEAEDTNSIELQQSGWQAILNNFRKYTESN